MGAIRLVRYRGVARTSGRDPPVEQGFCGASPEFLLSVDPLAQSPVKLPENRVEIERHCKGLISRPGLWKGDDHLLADALPLFWSALGFDWNSHMFDLDHLRTERHDLFAALIVGKIGDTLAAIRTMVESDARHARRCIALRQWLLICAWRLQLKIAFIASSRRAATPEPFRSLCGVGDTTVAASLAWVSSFATSSAAHLKFYGLPGAPPLRGPRSLPVAFLNAALKPKWWCVDVPRSAKKRYDVALAPFALKIADRVPMVSSMVDSVDWSCACQHSQLYRAAGLPAFKRNKRRTLFSNWNLGLSPAAMLIMVTRRFLDGAAICAAVCAEPDIVFDRERLRSIRTSLSRETIRIAAGELAAELMEKWAPALENITIPYKLAAAFYDQAHADPLSPAAAHFALLDPLSDLADLHPRSGAAVAM